jgi:hypothetical protein
MQRATALPLIHLRKVSPSATDGYEQVQTALPFLNRWTEVILLFHSLVRLSTSIFQPPGHLQKAERPFQAIHFWLQKR